MEVNKTFIDGLLVIKPVVFYDERGWFMETYNENVFKQHGITEHFVQDNQSFSKKGVIRGLHFQKPPYAQGKLVRVIQGMVFDVAVDIRKNSPTYGKHYGIILSKDNFLQFYIPKGFAHGFVALEDNTVFAYKCSDFYNKSSEASILYNDPDLNINWSTDPSAVSEKDLVGVSFNRFISPF